MLKTMQLQSRKQSLDESWASCICPTYKPNGCKWWIYNRYHKRPRITWLDSWTCKKWTPSNKISAILVCTQNVDHSPDNIYTTFDRLQSLAKELCPTQPPWLRLSIGPSSIEQLLYPKCILRYCVDNQNFFARVGDLNLCYSGQIEHLTIYKPRTATPFSTKNCTGHICGDVRRFCSGLQFQTANQCSGKRWSVFSTCI